MVDPNLFHVDWGRTAEVLVCLIVLSFFVERIAALLFEGRWFVLNTKVPKKGSPEAIVEQAAIAKSIEIREITRPLTRDGEPTPAEQDAMHDRLRAMSAGLTPQDLLWPLDPTRPQGARDKANKTLDLLEARQQRRRWLGKLPIKEAIAFALALVICFKFDFDAISMIVLAHEVSDEGIVMTGAVIAGGSKASIKLFHDVMGVKSSALASVRDDPEPKGGGGRV